MLGHVSDYHKAQSTSQVTLSVEGAALVNLSPVCILLSYSQASHTTRYNHLAQNLKHIHYCPKREGKSPSDVLVLEFQSLKHYGYKKTYIL